MPAYYNEIDPYAATWLRNLIAAGHIAPGVVDERSIADVKPADLTGYTQCHFFAGIGVWSYALRRAGWPDDRHVWTGSCPCQPFSAAGKGEGAADPRHLWPEWFRLIRERRPVAIFGEQVSAAIRHDWLDLVSADLEGAGYAVGSAVLGAHSVGAPHIRQRLFFVADSDRRRQGMESGSGRGVCEGEARDARIGLGRSGRDGELAHDFGIGCERRPDTVRSDCEGEAEWRKGLPNSQCGGNSSVALGDTFGEGLAQQRSERGTSRGQAIADPREAAERTGASASTVGHSKCAASPRQRQHGRKVLPEQEAEGSGCASSTSFWSACDWLPCIDGKARPVEPGTFPLAHGAPARVGRLRAYGNAICAETATAFIRAYLGR